MYGLYQLYWKSNIGLELSWGGQSRIDMGGFQLCDVRASSHTLSTEFLGCSSKSWPPYWGWYLNATLGVKVILGLMLLSIKLLYCLQLLSNSAPGRGWPKCYVQSHRWPISMLLRRKLFYFLWLHPIQCLGKGGQCSCSMFIPSVDIDFCFSFKFMQFWTDFTQIKNQPKIVGNYCILGIQSAKIFRVLFPNLKTWDWP